MSTMNVQFDAELIARLEQQGPRYTSYPTADRFRAGYDAAAWRSVLARRAEGERRLPLSLYLHIPFCESLCYYCACNKIITKEHDKAAIYVDYLKREISMQAALLGQGERVEQLHLGGGTPTFLSDAQMDEVLAHLRAHFAFADDTQGEYSIEIDPRTVDAARVQRLRAQGFNRLSLGVQDFDPDVQKAVNRIQPESMTLEAIGAARAAGFRSVSIDLIYGLPLQTLATIGTTLTKVIAADPDRISIYNYAHMPQMFKSQRLIVDADLPSAQDKLAMLGLCIERLTQAGYVYIGMDHFAKPDDELAVAQRSGQLHRNFQGYSTHADTDMLSMGVSAISAVTLAYCQNEKSLERYYAALDRNELPLARGLELTDDDILRRDLIGRLMCDFAIDVRAVQAQYGLRFDAYFAPELARLNTYQADGLIEVGEDALRVTPKGRLLVRNLCMVFDRYFGTSSDIPLQRMRYSKTI